jgi:uncharacterized membrane protein
MEDLVWGVGKEANPPERGDTSPEPPGGVLLEPLPGAVRERYVKCGKPGCQCETGVKHGPYHYRVWRDGGRIRTAYVPLQDVEKARAQCALYRQYQGCPSLVRAERARLERETRQQLRQAIFLARAEQARMERLARYERRKAQRLLRARERAAGAVSEKRAPE